MEYLILMGVSVFIANKFFKAQEVHIIEQQTTPDPHPVETIQGNNADASLNRRVNRYTDSTLGILVEKSEPNYISKPAVSFNETHTAPVRMVRNYTS